MFGGGLAGNEQERLERIREKVSSLVDPLREAEEALAARFIAPEFGSDEYGAPPRTHLAERKLMMMMIAHAPPHTRSNKSLFSLIAGRYPKAVSLPESLESLPTLPGGPEALQIVIELIQSKTGPFHRWPANTTRGCCVVCIPDIVVTGHAPAHRR